MKMGWLSAKAEMEKMYLVSCMNKQQIEYIKKHNAKIATREWQNKLNLFKD